MNPSCVILNQHLHAQGRTEHRLLIFLGTALEFGYWTISILIIIIIIIKCEY